jgi:hypothetical protein
MHRNKSSLAYQVFFTVYIVCQTGGIVYGTGKHLKDLQPDRAQTALIFWWLCELFYIPAAVFLKLSVGVFLHRIAINPWHILIIRLMMFCSGVFGTVYLFLAIFQCKPISAWWIRKHSPLSKDYGWCFSNTTIVAVTFVSSGLNSIADWTFGLLSIFIVKDLQMPTKQKRLVAAILGFANIACVATVVRMPFILNLAKTDDFLYKTVDIALWSNVEPGVGIAAACVATLRPLLLRVIGRRASGWFSSGNVQKKYYGSGKNKGSSGQSYALRGSLPVLRPGNVGHYTEVTAGSGGQRRDRKEPIITGREFKDLFETTDSKGDDDPEQQMYLSAAAAEHANSTPTSSSPPNERHGVLEIQKAVEVTFTEEIAESWDGKRSSETNWPLAAPQLGPSKLASLGEQSRRKT